jgi:NAD(P)-dependent dehydrogenase (short-subunit alcohol dehydrogenase family)
VNVVGVLATSQAFLPLLRAGKYKGHIVNLGSVVSASALNALSALACTGDGLHRMH